MKRIFLFSFLSSFLCLSSFADDDLVHLSGVVDDIESYIQTISHNVSYLAPFVSYLLDIMRDTAYLSSRADDIHTILSYFKTNGGVWAKDSTLQSVLQALRSLSFDTSGLATENTLASLDSNLTPFYQAMQELIDYGTIYQIESHFDNTDYIDPMLYDYLFAVNDWLQADDLSLSYVGSSNLSPDLSEIWDNNYGDYDTPGLIPWFISAMDDLRWLNADVNYNLSNIGTCFSPLSPLGEGLNFLLDSDFSHSYASIGFASNSVPEEIDLTYAGMDFFNASIKLLSDGNKVNAATTYFLKHINDKMPEIKDTSEDEQRLQSQISSASDVKDSLDSAFTFSTVQFRDVDDYFDSTALLGQLDGSQLPSSLSFTLPSFGSFGAHSFVIETDSLVPFLNVSRAVFTLLYFVLLAGFVWYLFRVFFPLLVRFSTLLRSVLNW